MKLSWFRKYNKHILIWGGSLLMVAFLVQPTLDAFMPQPQDEPVGYIDGQELTYGDQQVASAQLSILESLSPFMLSVGRGDDAVLTWLLMKHEARQMGLSASRGYEPDALLTLMGVENPEQRINDIAAAMGVTEGFVRQTLQDWAMVQHYQELVSGLAHLPLEERITQYRQAEAFARGGYPIYFIAAMLETSRGEPRVSEPLLKRYAVDSFSQVRVAAVPVSANRYLSQVDEPSTAALQALFEEYKDDLPGEGEPYGFGYRLPRRAAVEYLEIPARRLQDTVQLREADFYDYYQQNRQQFVGQNGEVQPYNQVRDQIVTTLRSQKAQQLGNQMIKDARAQLDTGKHQLPVEGAYRVTKNYEPRPLQDVADDLQRRYGVLPEVHRYDRMMTLDELANLPGIGSAYVQGTDAPFAAYVSSAREFEPEESHRLLNLQLQAKLPSRPLVGPDGTSWYIFRLIEAQPSSVPQSLDEVREQVVSDARRKAAFEMLVENSDQWVQRAKREGLSELAVELGAQVVTTRPFARREQDAFGGAGAPNLPGIGQSEQFANGVFDFVSDLAASTEMEISQLPADRRITGVPAPQRLSLMLTRVESFQPVPQSAYEQQAAQGMLPHMVYQSLLNEVDQPQDGPFSLEAIKARTGFKSSSGAQESADEADAEEGEPGSTAAADAGRSAT